MTNEDPDGYKKAIRQFEKDLMKFMIRFSIVIISVVIFLSLFVKK